MEVLRDPGLQPERTGLAWQRVALAVMVCSALVARAYVEPAVGVAVFALASGLLAAVIIVANATRRERGTVVRIAGGDVIVLEDSSDGEHAADDEAPADPEELADYIAGTGKRFALISIFSIVLSALGLVAVLL